MAIAGSETKPRATAVEAESVKCDTCGFTEECTPPYISHVRERFGGRWICGLCAEAVEDEALRSPANISTEEALRRHVTFFQDFRSSRRDPQTPISAIGRIFRRSLDSPRRTSDAVRSGSCFSSLSTR